MNHTESDRAAARAYASRKSFLNFDTLVEHEKRGSAFSVALAERFLGEKTLENFLVHPTVVPDVVDVRLASTQVSRIFLRVVVKGDNVEFWPHRDLTGATQGEDHLTWMAVDRILR